MYPVTVKTHSVVDQNKNNEFINQKNRENKREHFKKPHLCMEFYNFLQFVQIISSA